MTIGADAHIILDVDTPKKDATVGTGVPLVGANECAIWGNTLTDPSFTTQTVATYRKLFRVLMDLSKKGGVGTLVASGAIDASEPGVAFAAPNPGEVGLYIGADIHAGAKTHFVDRTVKRLTERWLEEAKAGETPAP